MIKNTENNIKLELLAPARNLEAGKIAVLAGADAVYIGAPKFGARAAVGNSWDDIKSLVDFAHQYYARVYVALNTIFFDNEASLMKKSIEKAYEIGVDAAIIQDMGILEMDLPPLPLFASTQCHNYDYKQIKFLAEAGLSRIILARELSLRQIKNISKEFRPPLTPPCKGGESEQSQTSFCKGGESGEVKTPPLYKGRLGGVFPGVELEAFVHGALCVSFSGRCHFSQAICGKSANRGECVQVCRQTFDLVDADGKVLAKDKYLLSLRDLNLSERLNDLVEAGVTSFKIEGRLKDDAYVGNVTAEYRRRLDAIIDASKGKYVRASSGRVSLSFVPDLSRTFNRAYTEYFIDKRQSDIVSPESQKALGKFVGTVKECTRDYFVLKEKGDLKNGDGICWLSESGLVGVNVNKVDNWRIFPARRQYIAPGTKIYRNQDLAFEKAAASGAERRVAVDFIIEEDEKGFKVSIEDEDGNEFSKKFVIGKALAKKSGQEDLWREQFSKLGESIFVARDFRFALAEEYFVPMSILNEWRRELVAGLVKERSANYPRIEVEHKKTEHDFPVKKVDASYNVINALAKDFYKRHGAEVVEEAMEKTHDSYGKKLMTTKHCLKYWLGACSKKGKTSVEFKEPLYLVREGKKYKLKFDCQNCQMEIFD